ncbi:hypothetical protein [Streptomyces harbinensis]|uniref:Uncharacterized protein n=1 Tax=Streptomyces harbinensis TaxID=1176198 RepID=A0A1I6WAF7_9ACTN|nr:hypothetical protein [Streptomyces harbinensis]SFT22983.1 hypothetical protein SAMN05444716_11617 [Streptomyces harbinensis]
MNTDNNSNEQTTTNEVSGEVAADTVVQASTVHIQQVGEGHAIVGNVYGGLHYNSSPKS